MRCFLANEYADKFADQAADAVAVREGEVSVVKRIGARAWKIRRIIVIAEATRDEAEGQPVGRLPVNNARRRPLLEPQRVNREDVSA